MEVNDEAMAEELTVLTALEKRAEEKPVAPTEPETVLAEDDPVAEAVKDTDEGSAKVTDAAELNAVAGSLNADAGSDVKTSDALNV